MSWSNQLVGKSKTEVTDLIQSAEWNGLPSGVSSPLSNLIWNLPDVPEGYELVVSTNGHIYVPSVEVSKNYPPQCFGKIEFSWRKIAEAKQPPYMDIKAALDVSVTDSPPAPARLSE